MQRYTKTTLTQHLSKKKFYLVENHTPIYLTSNNLYDKKVIHSLPKRRHAVGIEAEIPQQRRQKPWREELKRRARPKPRQKNASYCKPGKGTAHKKLETGILELVEKKVP